MRKKALGFAAALLLGATLPAVLEVAPASAATEFPGTGLATNYDWAYLVLQDGGWPSTSNNLTVLTQWMDSEEPAARWWNRNNPLNNGLGSGGGSGLGSYGNVVDAAYYVADNLEYDGLGYPAIASDLAASAPPQTTAKAIWDSSWAAGHYGHGRGWFTGRAPTVAAPPRAWGSDVVVTYPAGTIGPGTNDGFTLNGPPQYWHASAPLGIEGQARWTYSNGATGANGATWAPTLGAGSYDVTVFVPPSFADANVTYVVTDAAGTHKVPVDQASVAGTWVQLGVFTATATSLTVHVGNTSADPAGSTYVGVDAMRFKRVGPPSAYPAGIVGPGGPGFALKGPAQTWHAGAPYGLKGDVQWSASAGTTGTATARWSPTLSPGSYDVQAFVPAKYATAHVTYELTDASGTHNVTVDQSKFANQWVNLGQLTAGAADGIAVTLSNASSDPVGLSDVAADAVKFVGVGPITTSKSTTTLPASIPTVRYGSEVTYAASVRATGITPSGTVTFSIGPLLLCTATVEKGAASCATSYTPAGTHPVTARYLGSATVAPSWATVSADVVRAVSTTTLVIQPGAVTTGAIVTYAVSVQSSSSMPAGVVSIGVNGVVVCTAHLVTGNGSCKAAAGQPGHFTVFARYAGNRLFLPSSSRSGLTVT